MTHKEGEATCFLKGLCWQPLPCRTWGKKEERSTAHHPEAQHGECSAVLSGRHCKQLCSLRNGSKVNICSCGSSAMPLELIHFLTFSQLLACSGISSHGARLDFKGKVPEVTGSSLIHCSASVLEEVL